MKGTKIRRVVRRMICVQARRLKESADLRFASGGISRGLMVELGVLVKDGFGDCAGLEEEVVESWMVRCSHRYLLRPRNQSHSVL